MSTGHDDGELDLEAKLEEPDEDACELLVRLLVDWSRVVSKIKQIHCVGRALYGKRVGAKGIEDLQDRVEHRGSEGTSGRVVAESHAEISCQLTCVATIRFIILHSYLKLLSK